MGVSTDGCSHINLKTDQPTMNIRRIIILAVTATISYVAAYCRGYSESDYAKLIARYDVADTVMHANTAEDFWSLLQMTDRQFGKIAKSMSGKGDKDLKRIMVATVAACDTYFREVDTDGSLYSFNEAIIDQSGLRGIAPTAIMSVTREGDVASFSYPNGYFFITQPLYELLEGDSAAILALISAEGAHYALQHAYAHSKWEKSRRNKLRFWSIFGAAAVTTAGIIIDQATDGYSPALEIASIAAVAMTNVDHSPRYSMIYTPEQIFQADIVAYRFMEWVGYGGHKYIEALHRVGFHIDAANPQTDAPQVTERIALLDYLETHPELRTKAKHRKRQPRPVAPYQTLLSPSNYQKHLLFTYKAIE